MRGRSRAKSRPFAFAQDRLEAAPTVFGMGAEWRDSSLPDDVTGGDVRKTGQGTSAAHAKHGHDQAVCGASKPTHQGFHIGIIGRRFVRACKKHRVALRRALLRTAKGGRHARPFDFAQDAQDCRAYERRMGSRSGERSYRTAGVRREWSGQAGSLSHLGSKRKTGWQPVLLGLQAEAVNAHEVALGLLVLADRLEADHVLSGLEMDAAQCRLAPVRPVWIVNIRRGPELLAIN